MDTHLEKKNFDNMAEIEKNILLRYKSFEQPSLFFVNEVYDRDGGKDAFFQLLKYFEVEDLTDTNDDVSFVYLLKKGTEEWQLRHSMVGNYFLLYKFIIGVERNILLVEYPQTENEIFIRDLVIGLGGKFLSKDILDKKINLNLYDEPNPTIFRCLFSDNYDI